MQTVGLTIVHRDPMGIKLGDRIRRTRIEGRSFRLRYLARQAEQFRCRSLVKTRFFDQLQLADAFKQPQGADRVSVCCVFGSFKTYHHMALRGKIVYFVRFCVLDNAMKRGGVRKIAVMQEELRAALMRVLIKMIDPGCIET